MSALTQDSTAKRINVYEVMVRMGVDRACGVLPRFALTTLCALRTCATCNLNEPCSDWLAKAPDILSKPPSFCPSMILMSEILLDPASVQVRPQGTH
jgi:hypothetical protein